MLIMCPAFELLGALKRNPFYQDLFVGQEGLQNFAYCIATCLDNLGMGFCRDVLHGRFIEYSVRCRLINLSQQPIIEQHVYRNVDSFTNLPIDGWSLKVLPNTVTLIFEHKQE